MPGLSLIKRFEPIALTLLFFGIYTTERLKVGMGGVSLRYSFLFLAGSFLFAFVRKPRLVTLTLLNERQLIPFLPFLICSSVSALASKEPNTALLVWGYNALTLAVCFWFVQKRNPQDLAKPWIIALLAHSIMIFWDEATVAHLIPNDWAVGLLYTTGATQRPSGFYIAPQFYGTAFSLSGFIWLTFFGARSNMAYLGIPVFVSTWFSMSRTGLAATLCTLCMLGLMLPWLKSKSKEAIRVWLIAFNGLLLGAIVMNLAAPIQASQLNASLGLRPTWTRVCPIFKTIGLISMSCAFEDLTAATSSSEGRRLAEWKQVLDDLRQSPLLGLGYAGALDSWMPTPPQETAGPAKRVRYRFESVWATVISYYGIFGLITLIGALAILAHQTRWSWTLAAPIAYWLVGGHSSHVFARLDIWLPLFIYLRCICQTQESQTGAHQIDA